MTSLAFGSLRASLAVAAALALATPAAAASLDFLHIEANEGGSSGGHAALRFGDLEILLPRG